MSDLDPVLFDEMAIASTRARLATLTVADLGRPSVCEGWTVRDVLAHLVGGNIRFAQALRGERAHWESRDSQSVTSPVAEYDPTAAELAETIARIDDPGRPVALPAGEPPAFFAIKVHAADMLLHGWDIAVSTAQEPTLDPQLCLAAIAVLERYPASFWGPGRFFAARQEGREGDPQQRLLALSGRDPEAAM